MMTTKILENGENQVVILPEECRLDAEEVSVAKSGDIVILAPKRTCWNSFMQAADMFSDDYMECGRANQFI